MRTLLTPEDEQALAWAQMGGLTPPERREFLHYLGYPEEMPADGVRAVWDRILDRQARALHDARTANEGYLRERNLWARKQADLRDERDTALEEAEKARSERSTVENDRDVAELLVDDLRSRLACIRETTWWDRPYDTRLQVIVDLATLDTTPRTAVVIPRPQITTGPRHQTVDEATVAYLCEAADRVRTQRYWGSGVSALVAGVLADVATAIASTALTDHLATTNDGETP